MLDQLISAKKFEEVLEFLKDEKNDLDPFYVDQAGNSWVHLVLIAMQESIVEFYRPFQSYRTVYCKDLEPIDKKLKIIFDLVLRIFSLLKQRNCSFCHRNSENKSALDFLRAIKIPFFDQSALKKLKIFLIKSLESDTHFLLAGRKYVTDLSLFRGAKNPRKRVEIPDAFDSLGTSLSLHQLLASYEYHLDRFNLGVAAKNFAVATMSFIVSSEPQIKNGNHGRRLITIPIHFENLAVKVVARKHSEHALLENLKKDMALQSQSALVAKLFQQCGNQQGFKVYNAILDFHSTREVCQDCETHLREFQTDFSPEGFSTLLVTQLKRSGFVVSAKRQQPVPLIVRASGLDDPNWSGRPDPVVAPPMFYAASELDRDVRHCHPGVLFHLPPMAYREEESASPQGKRYYSGLLGDSDSERMDSEYKRRRLSTHVDVFPFSMGLFTAFANGGGRATDEIAKAELLSELVDLSNEQLAKVMSV